VLSIDADEAIALRFRDRGEDSYSDFEFFFLFFFSRLSSASVLFSNALTLAAINNFIRAVAVDGRGRAAVVIIRVCTQL